MYKSLRPTHNPRAFVDKPFGVFFIALQQFPPKLDGFSIET